jgi:hypothetical protein
MAGIIIFIWAAMHHLADRYGSILVDFDGIDPRSG